MNRDNRRQYGGRDSLYHQQHSHLPASQPHPSQPDINSYQYNILQGNHAPYGVQPASQLSSFNNNPYLQNPNFFPQDPNIYLQPVSSMTQQPQLPPTNIVSNVSAGNPQIYPYPMQQIPSRIHQQPPSVTPNLDHNHGNIENPQASGFQFQSPSGPPHKRKRPSSAQKSNTSSSKKEVHHTIDVAVKNTQHLSSAVKSPSILSRSEGLPTKQRKDGSREDVQKIEVAAAKAWRELIASGESVSAWKVSQSVLEALGAESWDSMGVQFHEVPSLRRLILTEGKINAYIHCYVAVREITSLFDMKSAICLNEGVKKFEALELGPLVRHPLVLHYFSADHIQDIYQITSEQIISYLVKYLTSHKETSVDREEFLDFIARKRKVASWKTMGLRIQSLRMHVSLIREAMRSNNVLKMCREAGKNDVGKKKCLEDGPGNKMYNEDEQNGSGIKWPKLPLYSLEKKQIDERFNAITDRVTSFVSANKHIHFVSSSGDDVSSGNDYDSADEGDGVERGEDNCKHKGHQLSSQKINSDKFSSCPYPSVAEEKARLGIPGEVVDYSPSHSRLQNSEMDKPVKKKRKLGNQCSPIKKKGGGIEIEPTTFTDDNVRIFITTWKEACREHTAAEVFEKMWLFYDISLGKRKRILKSFVSSDLFKGLLNVAVASIKNGCWDSIYDTFQSIDDVGLPTVQSPTYIDCEALDVEPSEKNLKIAAYPSLDHKLGVTVDQIIRKMIEYLDTEKTLAAGRFAPLERNIMFGRNLLKCEAWLNNQFSVKEFKSLGYGDYLAFLEGHMALLSEEMLKCLDGKAFGHFSPKVSMLQQQLITLLAQASNSLWDDGCLTSQRISYLLLRQFPLGGFNLTENGSLKDLQDTVNEYKSGVLSNNVLFSATLSGMDNVKDPIPGTERYLLDNASPGVDIGEKEVSISSVTSKDAVKALFKAPMLIDLNSWLHWDIIYAPSLGPLLRWLLFDVSSKDFLCLATREGKIIRVNHSASADSFFKALLHGSSFHVAVEILSLLAVYGGKKHLPASLLKCHAHQAFDAILSNSVDLEINDSLISCINEKASKEIQALGSNRRGDNAKETVIISRLILDCLGHLPSEFHSLAAEILLPAWQSLVKNAAEVVLRQCNTKEQHLMLHEVGFSLGITEWIDDHHKLCPIADDSLCVAVCSLPSLRTISKMTEMEGGSHASTNNLFSSGKKNSSAKEDGHAESSARLFSFKDGIEVDCSAADVLQHVDESSRQKDAFRLIESIRHEEFGLDSEVESSLLKKQHARLGRALHCLSQELYSQDSHFLLELIQNADDNVYPDNAEPTLVFILQETGIIILNNERGFMAHNIRALCDVGNSTKKGSSAGYIGKKGIGFKSVFRVTDTPEIHSNGFHIKFDISEGQIGFVLPTVIPPCNLNHIRQLASPSHEMDHMGWNTCIVLPFRLNSPQGQDIGRILSMLSDIHPSILLFLHRLQCIKMRNMIDDSFLVMRKEVLGDGLMRVSYGERTMTWFIASKSLHAKVIRHDVQATEISVAFTLEESEGGSYEAHLEQQPVFAFLPLRTYGLKFILQGDFVLPSSREEVDEDSPWNQWLLSEFPSLFVGAEKSFCELPCFSESTAKAVSIYMRFVPLAGDVHGFFSSLPRMIISKLRLSDCLLQEGATDIWVPPCKVLRNWNEQSQRLLPEDLLRKYLGLGFLKKDVLVPDSLARALGIEEYGPKVLVQFLSSLCCVENGNGLKSMDLRWLCTLLNELYNLLKSSGKAMEQLDSELDLINILKKLPFIPLSNGTHSSLNEGTIWLSTDFVGTGFDCDDGRKFFPNLYATLRIVSPHLFPAASESTFCPHSSLTNNVRSMLHWIGVQNLTAHDIIKVHILPSISDEKSANQQKCLFIEYTAYVMLHLQSNCPDCHVEKENVISEFRDKALLFTNYGCKRLKEVPVHFGGEYGNSIIASQFVNDMDYTWHEIDVAYLKHPIFESLPCGLQKLREFFQSLGVTDFVNVTQIEKPISELSPSILQHVTWDSNMISSHLLVEDWESEELAYILSSLTRNRSLEKSKYLMEVIDRLWDTYLTEKASSIVSSKSGGDNLTLRSSLMNNICTVQWVASSADDKLHYPSELFHDCDAVSSVFGDSAAYAVPKIKSRTLISNIGLKTQVTIDDALATLEMWSKVETPLNASISQMSRLYNFISIELASSKEKIMDSLCSDRFIFVPSTSGNNLKDIVPGVFLSPQEVYWDDSTGALNSLGKPRSSIKADVPLNMLLGKLYPGLRDFFVHDCGVAASPPFRYYLQILKQLSVDALPLEAASTVFQVLLLWSDGLECGDMGPDDIAFLRSNLLQVEFSVLPAFRDKWVSLHPSYGLVCWPDDDKLKKQFKHLDNVEFLYFGKLTDTEKELLQTKVSILLKKLSIPSLSEVVTREAIYYGSRDSRVEASIVAWALPFAQRYIRNVHPEKYDEIKQLGFEKLQNLKVVVVERLFYRNVIKNCSVSSKKRVECSCLLQDTTLYTTHGSNSHSIFMELSRLFFNGEPDLHLANFLHMLTTMVESGSTEEQLELFILNSQNMPKPPDEPLWCISLPIAEENDEAQLPMEDDVDQDCKIPKKRPGITTYWPPSDWKTAPRHRRSSNYHPVNTSSSEPCNNMNINEEKTPEEVDEPVGDFMASENEEDITMVEEKTYTLPESYDMISTTSEGSGGKRKGKSSSTPPPCFSTPINLVLETHSPDEGTPKDKSSKAITIGAQQAMFTGKLGEAIAFEYFKETHGNSVVKWVNEENETGLPYDLIVGGENERTVEFVEVKATRYDNKNWFVISTREWQLALEKGNSFSIAHVVMSNPSAAKITLYRNPAKLCQQGKLQLALMAPKQYTN